MTEPNDVMLLLVILLALGAVVLWLLAQAFSWVWNNLWDWHESELTTKRGDLE